MTVTTDTPVKSLQTIVVAKDATLPSIRDWARAQGYVVGERGRILHEIAVAYTAAHGLDAPPAPKSVSNPYTPSPIRAWALANGHIVPARGRFSLEVTAAYDAAQGIVVPPVADKPVKGAPKVRKSRKKVAVAPVETEDVREANLVKVGGRGGSLLICGFCTDKHACDHCPDTLTNGANVDYNVKCACAAGDHQ